MPKAGGRHYSYTKKFNGVQFRSSGRTFTKAGAKKRAAKLRKSRPGIKARSVRLGKTPRYAIYANTTIVPDLDRGGY